MTRTRYALALALLLTLAAGGLAAEETGTLAQAFTEGTTTLDFNYRLEAVDDDALAKDALASTLRTSLAFRSGHWKRLQFFIEAENVTAVGDEDGFNNKGAAGSGNGVTDRPVVADPNSTELNQAYLRMGLADTKLTLGRQELVLGDSRHVGNVGWRQNHQSFDAVSLTSSSLEGWTLHYSFIDRVNRIFGDSQKMTSHALHAAGKVGAAGKLTAYGLLLDYEDPALFGLSSSSLGVELTGSRKAGDSASFSWELEYAVQQDFGDNPGTLDTDYSHIAFGGGTSTITGIAGLESLGGSPADGQYRTPLATLHKFNGWADKFLATPVNGLDDLYLTLKGKAGKVGWQATWHDFSATTGSVDYGTELDLLASFKTSWGQTFGLKAALYSADSHSTDTDKVMAFTRYRFQ